MVAVFDPTVKQILPELGKKKNATSKKSQEILGWQPRSKEEAILSTARSLASI